MRQKFLFLIPIFIIIGFISGSSASATITCPVDDGAGVVCSGSTPYYCASSCRSMDSAYCPTNELTAVSPCATLDSCGVCNTCIASYLLCTSSTYPTRSCTYNDPANHCATLTNSNCTAGACASCVSGYTRCATSNTCIATQSCPPGQTFNACTVACEGTISMLKLGYDSVSGTNVIQSVTYPALYIPSTSYVGIGTSAPNDIFSITDSGTAAPAGSSGTGHNYASTYLSNDDYALTNYGVVKTLIAGGSGSTVGYWGLSGSNLYASSTAWKVGIGTTVPVSSLDVETATTTFDSALVDSLQILAGNFSSSTGGGKAGMGFSVSTAIKSNGIYGAAITHTPIAAYSQGGLEFWTKDTNTVTMTLSEKMRLTYDGKLGIGTTGPTQRLHVANGGKLAISDAGNDRTTTFEQRDDNNFLIQTDVGGIGFGTSGATDEIFIKSGGNVGIGTVNPQTLLSIGGAGSEKLGTEKVRIIGTNPTVTGVNTFLHLDGAGNSSAWDRGIAIEMGTKNNTWSEYTSRIVHYGNSAATVGSRLQLQTHSGSVGSWNIGILIDNSGNVGIGTTAPAARLEVVPTSGYAILAGTSTAMTYKIGNVATPTADTDAATKAYVDSTTSASQSAYWNLNGSNLYASSTAWNVGIGTTNPSQKLEVNGIIKSTGMITTWKSARLDPTNSKWHKIGTLTLTGQYHTYQGTFMTNMRGITNDNDVTSIYKFTARQPAMTSSPIVDIHHLGSVSNNGTSFDVKAIITADTESSKTIDLYVGNVNSNYLYYSHSILNQSIEVGGSFSIVEGDTGVLVGSLPAGTQVDMVKGLTTLNSGYVGIGIANPTEKVHVSGGNLLLSNVVGGINLARLKFYYNDGSGNNTDSGGVQFVNDNAAYYSEISGYRGGSSVYAGLNFKTANNAVPATQMIITPAGFVGIGTTAPNDILSITGSGTAAPAGSSNTGHNYASTYLSEDDYALANYGLVKTLIAGTAGTYETGGYLPLSGVEPMQGDIDMSGYSINQVGTLTVEKLNATTIDPLYFLNGINYATFVSSVVGGVKEEYVGKIKINRKVAAPTVAELKTEFEAVVDFAKTEEGGELWVWRQIVDFSKDGVDVLITPYGEFASVYYLIQDNKLIFRSDRPAEISYRLVGKRFDWRKWPLKVKDQTRQGVQVK